jgi:hypothetical protein
MAEPLPQLHCQSVDEASSRTEASWAGWEEVDGRPRTWREDRTAHGEWQDRLDALPNRRWQTFSWLSVRALLDSVNDQIGKYLGDLVDPRRQRWIAAQRAAGHDPDGILEAPVDDERRPRAFMIVGDPGEIDASQFAVIPPLETIDAERGSDFLVVLSDVIYPAGEVDDYAHGFYEAFKPYGKPIYALPGNHDWYDGLNGFMWHFCGAEALPPTEYRRSSYTASERAARMLWRRAARPSRARLLAHRSPQGEPWQPRQPGPYWAMDVGEHLRLVSIDTGITGRIDREQAHWLLRMSKGPRAKVLLTGKPIWVDGRYHPGEIDWGEGTSPPEEKIRTVDDVVRARKHKYRAVIGGDIHNYQRLTVTAGANDREGPRRIEYVVTGGGGAYLSDTQRISVEAPWGIDEGEQPEDIVGPGEEQFRCYPTRADALAYYTRWYGPRIVALLGIALFVLLGAVTAIVCWDRGGSEIGGQNVLAVALVGVGGVLGVILVALPAVLVGALVFKRGARFTAFALLAPVLYGLAAVGLSEWVDDDWWWVWRSTLLGVGALVVPLVVIALAYYGLATPLRRRIGALVVIVACAALHLGEFGSAAEWTGTVAVSLLTIVFLLWLVQPGHERLPAGPLRWAPLSAVLTIALYHAPLAAALWEFESAWALKAAVAVELGLLAFVALLVVGVTVLCGGRALWHLRTGRLDPDDAFAVLRARGIEEALAPNLRQGDPSSKAAQRIATLLMGQSLRRKIGRLGLAQIGNADTPPMFKSFVRAELSEDGSELELSCYGVTGWCRHESPASDVPREDCVRIPL